MSSKRSPGIEPAPFRAIVVDDEPLARQLLRASLKSFAEIEVIEECANGREAIQAINNLKPDLMFLDIQMPGLTGFDVIRNVPADAMPEIVFVTAYDEFAIDAFDANAVDYLLKPISEERLARAVRRALAHLFADSEEHKRRELYSAVSKIADRVRAKTEQADADEKPAEKEERKLSIKDGDSVVIVREADIDWIDAAGDYMCVHVNGDTHVVRSTMHELLGRLDQEMFKRVHRSTVVNVERIVKIQNHTKGEYLLHLDCGETLKVSRHYKSVIRDFIDNKP